MPSRLQWLLLVADAPLAPLGTQRQPARRRASRGAEGRSARRGRPQHSATCQQRRRWCPFLSRRAALAAERSSMLLARRVALAAHTSTPSGSPANQSSSSKSIRLKKRRYFIILTTSAADWTLRIAVRLFHQSELTLGKHPSKNPLRHFIILTTSAADWTLITFVRDSPPMRARAGLKRLRPNRAC